MAKRRKSGNLNVVDDGFYLLLSIAGGVLFSFGLLDWFKELTLPSWVAVAVGAFLVIGLIVFRKYTTETAFALKRKKR